MKFKKSLLPILAAGATVLTATPTFSQSNPNKNVGFRCDANQDILTTVAYNTKTGEKKPLIHWRQEYIDSQNIRADCEGAAKKFQSRYNNNKLTLWAIDASDSKKPIVFCLINRESDGCDLKSSEELFRLKTTVKYQDSHKALSEIVKDSLGKGKANEIRTVGLTFGRMEPRKWFFF